MSKAGKSNDHHVESPIAPTRIDPTNQTNDEETTQTDLLGGLRINSTADIRVPNRLVDQVIGQEHARETVMKAAKQRRHVMLIGSPGTGKSMLGKAMAELLPREELQDVLVSYNRDDPNRPHVRTVPAGDGRGIVEVHKAEARKRMGSRSMMLWILIIAIMGYALLIANNLLMGMLAAGIVFIAFGLSSRRQTVLVPKLLINNGYRKTAPFEDATGAHAGALLGDVRHDPFQSGGMETPGHDRVEAGAIHKANKGVLFIDEINTLDTRSQQNLMTAIQEGEFSITGQSERSSGAMVKTEPVPADFIMIAAGNVDAMENMHPALRSRIKGYGYEVYMDDTISDTPETRRKYVRFVAQEVANDGRIPHFNRQALSEVLLEAQRRSGRQGYLTLELRDLGGLVRVAGDIARTEGSAHVTRNHVLQAKGRSRSVEQQFADDYIERHKDYELAANEGYAVGRVNGLAVMGEDSGIVLPVMTEVTPSQGSGDLIVTGRLREVAIEAIQNVSAVVKKFSETGLNEKDVHIQFLQAGAGVDGDSASVTVATAVISALEDVAVDQSLAMTGSLSVHGDVLPVNGVTYMIEAAAKAGLKRVVVPRSNLEDVLIEDEYRELIEIIPVSDISEVLEAALESAPEKRSLVKRFDRLTESPQPFRLGPGRSPSPR